MDATSCAVNSRGDCKNGGVRRADIAGQAHSDTTSGVRKTADGRQKGHTRQVLERARLVGICRGAGLPDELILSGMSPHELPGLDISPRERQRLIRKKLNRWETPGRSRRDSAKQQALGYATRALGDDWVAVCPEPGWTPAEDETPAAMEATARQLEQQAQAVPAAEDADSFAVSRFGEAEDYCRLIDTKVAVLRGRARDVGAAEHVARDRPMNRRWIDPNAT